MKEEKDRLTKLFAGVPKWQRIECRKRLEEQDFRHLRNVADGYNLITGAGCLSCSGQVENSDIEMLFNAANEFGLLC